jgi:hypothetical protein
MRRREKAKINRRIGEFLLALSMTGTLVIFIAGILWLY